jgi:tRNA threonylcarbamoyladenosine biosynthesis protein TsaE
MTDDHDPHAPTIECTLDGQSATEQFAAALARDFAPGFVVYLSGGLGAGKTTLTRALLRALGFNGRVKSPTFALLEPYNLPKFALHHYDFYRLESPEAWREAGFESSFDGQVAVVIEWPERAGGTLPPPDLEIELHVDPVQEDRRLATIRAHGPRGAACVSRLRAEGCCAGVSSAA